MVEANLVVILAVLDIAIHHIRVLPEPHQVFTRVVAGLSLEIPKRSHYFSAHSLLMILIAMINSQVAVRFSRNFAEPDACAWPRPSREAARARVQTRPPL